ncbi:2-oxoglutarate-dependent ethylene/succinate-forming enzyme [Balamuthia mandrillaris]
MDKQEDAQRGAFEAIPVIDLEPMYQGNIEKSRKAAKEIGDACRNVGFFYIKGHRLSKELLERVYEQTKLFFELDPAEKQKVAMKNHPDIHRGYFSYMEEITDVSTREAGGGDLKEGIDIGHDDEADEKGQFKPLHGKNQWPERMEGFKEVMEEYFREIEALGKTLLHAFAIDLSLDNEFYFHDMFTPGMSLLRLLHYPPQNPQAHDFNPNQIGCGVHTDYGCVTILSQDAEGLQVMNRAGEWVNATPIKNSLLVNLGDMMERWTNGIYKATPHRVVNISGKDRYSIPFFFEPNFETLVEPLPACITQERPRAYEPVGFGNHLLYKLNTTFEYRSKNESSSSTSDASTTTNNTDSTSPTFASSIPRSLASASSSAASSYSSLSDLFRKDSDVSSSSSSPLLMEGGGAEELATTGMENLSLSGGDDLYVPPSSALSLTPSPTSSTPSSSSSNPE